ncbi:Protein CBG04776 [Caenorhabditis briggsae]|uniref:Protein CBG04776 n=1 Tax=Caenorhabditis briggsae TaxID=6238 RepID=A8WYG0_CAEBR|nr:Protein CBG04776 [Caenorhabditis briggsae]CAP25418.2 Protein CBG04776 [Caenorhabditis briggsae]
MSFSVIPSFNMTWSTFFYSKQLFLFRSIGDYYIDPDFLHTAGSLGAILDQEADKQVFDDLHEPWYPPHYLSDYLYRNDNHAWHIWNDPWPFHVCQAGVGNCWLMASLMAIAQRKDILEIVLPKRDYALDCGLVQVRLFVDGRWQVIKIDFYLPHENGIERCSKMPKKQMWVAMIEKAYAKVKGSFGGLNGGQSHLAFKCLTGAGGKQIMINKDTNTEQLWEDLIKYYSCGNLLAAGTPNIKDNEEELKRYEAIKIDYNHGYAILGFKEHNGYRLINLGNPGPTKFTGRFSELPGYDDRETVSNFCPVDYYLYHHKIFWMDIEDFVIFFTHYYVCEYRPGWEDYSMRQKIKRVSGKDTQVLRLEVHERCEVIVGTMKHCNGIAYETFLNIHKSAPNGECGDLISSTHASENAVLADPMFLDPGVYFVIPIFYFDVYEMVLDWKITSSRPVTFSFVHCPFDTYHASFLQGLIKNGEANRDGANDNVFFYTFKGQNSLFVVAENFQKHRYIRVSGKVSSPSLKPDEIKGEMGFRLSWPVPPMRAGLIGFVRCSKLSTSKIYINIQYSVRCCIWKLLDWIDALMLCMCDLDRTLHLEDRTEIEEKSE